MAIQLKSAAEIAKLREANLIVADVLDTLEAAAKPGRQHLGARTRSRPTGSSSSRPSRRSSATTATRPCSAPRSTGGRPRHPAQATWSSRTATSSPSTSAPSRTAGAVTRRGPFPSGRSVPAGAGADRRHPGVAGPGHRRSASRATGWGTSAGPSSPTSRRAGYSVVRQFVGHGIGRAMHEEPHVPNYGDAGQGPAAVGRPGDRHRADGERRDGPEVSIEDDGWTAVTKDGSLSAHFEHSVAITDDGPMVLSRA